MILPYYIYHPRQGFLYLRYYIHQLPTVLSGLTGSERNSAMLVSMTPLANLPNLRWSAKVALSGGGLGMQQFTIHVAKTNLSKRIEPALSGEEIVIAKGSKPVVRLVP